MHSTPSHITGLKAILLSGAVLSFVITGLFSGIALIELVEAIPRAEVQEQLEFDF